MTPTPTRTALAPAALPLAVAGLPWWAFVLIAVGALVVIVFIAGARIRPKPRAATPARPAEPPARRQQTPASPEPPAVAPAPAGLSPAPPPRPDPPRLVFKEGSLAGKRIEVRHELVLGREHVDVLIEDAEVSRRHASVRPVDGRLEIADLGSSNGTFVNGVRLRESRRLEDGDEIRLGNVRLRVDVPTRAAATVIGSGPDATVIRDDGQAG